MISFLVFLRSERYSSVGYRWISSHGSSISCSDHLRYVCMFQMDGLQLFLAGFFFSSSVFFPAVNGTSINGDEINGNGNSPLRFKCLCSKSRGSITSWSTGNSWVCDGKKKKACMSTIQRHGSWLSVKLVFVTVTKALPFSALSMTPGWGCRSSQQG